MQLVHKMIFYQGTRKLKFAKQFALLNFLYWFVGCHYLPGTNINLPNGYVVSCSQLGKTIQYELLRLATLDIAHKVYWTRTTNETETTLIMSIINIRFHNSEYTEY